MAVQLPFVFGKIKLKYYEFSSLAFYHGLRIGFVLYQQSQIYQLRYILDIKDKYKFYNNEGLMKIVKDSQTNVGSSIFKRLSKQRRSTLLDEDNTGIY